MPPLDRREFLIASSATAGAAAVTTNSLGAKTGRLRITGLKVDCINRPLGLENPRPRLSWRLESEERNVRQSAYRILVASTEGMLDAERGDLWDSGKASSRKSLGIRYGGTALISRQRCWWCVQVWDETGRSSAWSDASGWEMGLLSAEDWQAQWLAVEDSVAKADRQAGLQWICGAAAKDEVSRKFRLKVRLSAATLGGMLLVGGKDRVVGVWTNGTPAPLEPPPKYSIGPQPLSQIGLSALARGDHVFAVEVQTAGPMGSPAGAMTAFIRLELENGTILRIASGPQWRTSLTRESMWFTLGYNDQDWETARAATGEVTQPWPPTPAMHLRREFSLDRTVARARLYATALGAYEARLNGQRVGDSLLTPESTQYSKRLLYNTYDVTKLMRSGANVLGLTVGDGWYASTLFLAGRYAWGLPPRRVLAQLELTFSDGSREVVATESQWRISQSAIVSAEIYNGEIYDARLQQIGWDATGFDDSKWEEAEPAEKPPCHLSSQVSAPIRAVQTLKPRAITRPAPGVYVFDFGQNFAGWCRLHVKGPAGTRIEMQFAEMLLPSGEVDRSNLRGAKQTDVFILRGDSTEESFEPHFTYHGFRYVQVTGCPTAPTEDTLEGIVIHSDVEMTGRLRIYQPLIERIWRNTLWTQRSNLMGIPTDCPQRDERLGYLGDAGIFWDAAAFNMDVAAFTRRHMQTAADSQNSKGAYPHFAPIVSAFSAVPGWSDGAIILPWTVWQRYGDLTIIEQNWEGMNRYLRLIQDNNLDHIWRNQRVVFGDWLAVDEKEIGDPTTPPDLISTAYWAHSVDLLAQMAAAIGHTDDSIRLRSLHDHIRHAFANTFVSADGRVGNESQTGYVLALKYGLVPGDIKPRTAERLAADVRRRGGALSTGILGTQFILDVLVDSGYASLAYDLLLRTQYPSWGYMVANGATTIWESWNGRVWSGPKGETMPNSFNQYALGAVVGFLFRRVAGIDSFAPGFETIAVRPMLDPRVRHGGGDYDSVMGRISTAWTQGSDGGLTLDVTVPANATAHIHLPSGRDSRIEEGRKAIGRRNDMRIVQQLDQETVIEVGSGTYRFVVR